MKNFYPSCVAIAFATLRIFFLSSLFVTSFICNICYAQNASDYLYRSNENLVNVIMEDVFNPPQASRVQVYPNIAAYQVLCFKHTSLPSLAGTVTGLAPLPPPLEGTDLSLAACVAFNFVAKKLVYSEYLITQFETKIFDDYVAKHQGDSTMLKQSIAYGNQVGKQMMTWVKADNYNYTRTLMRYQLSDTAGSWQPTGPAYMNALEPNWHYMRSLFFDSITIVVPIPNIVYSEDKKSTFYTNAKTLYDETFKHDSSHRYIALYWDDNANTLTTSGHISYFVHKVTPGGHWIRIAGQTIRHLNMDEAQTAKIYMLLTVSIYEGFLSCWTEKFRSNAVRPETYINKFLDPQWKSFIETPPFPEYTSGHSVVSAASAHVLATLVPQPYSFYDSSQVYLDMPPRFFDSFSRAAQEASISRFYGGIHFMPALVNGALQGREVANSIINKFNDIKK